MRDALDLIAIAGAAVILTPSALLGMAKEIGTGDMMTMASLSGGGSREKQDSAQHGRHLFLVGRHHGKFRHGKRPNLMFQTRHFLRFFSPLGSISAFEKPC